MWYYYKSDNCFHDTEIEDQPCDREYTDEEYDELHDVDIFHFVGLAEGDDYPSQIRLSDEECIATARRARPGECFVYVNRGEVWYNTLTDEQKAELQEWYQAWLDITVTLVIPTRPEWLT